MNANTIRLLRILAVVAFVVGLIFVVLGDGPTEYAELIYVALLAGLALFSLSFAS